MCSRAMQNAGQVFLAHRVVFRHVGSDVMLGECDSLFAGLLQLVLSLTFSISLTAEQL